MIAAPENKSWFRRALSVVALDKYRNTTGVTPIGTVGAVETIGPQDFGAIPVTKRGRLSGMGEPPSISRDLDISKIQNALKAAERGETTQLFQIYRDIELGGTHLQSEFSKRKMVIVGQPYTIAPWDKDSAADKAAAEVIEEMIDGCENWNDAMIHLMEAALYPVSVMEKIYEPADMGTGLRFALKRLDPVSPFLFCFKLAYLASGGYGLPNGVVNLPAPSFIPMPNGGAYDTTWNPDSWEPDLRFFHTFPNGYVDYSWANIYAPDPERHIVHRGNLLSKSIRDNYGGVMRACVFWWFLSILGRDWFSRGMERYGAPFPVAKVDVNSVDTINFIKQAFSECLTIGGLLVSKDAEIELISAVQTNMAQGYEIFLNFCNNEISKVIVGQSQTSNPKPTGIGSGQAKEAAQVSEDYRQFDEQMMSATLRAQVFEPFLKINGHLDCHAPRITWGGMSEEESNDLLLSIKTASDAGLEPTDKGMEKINERTGIEYQKKAVVTAGAMPGKPNAKAPTKSNESATAAA